MEKTFKQLVTLGMALSLSILSITTAFASEWKQDLTGWKIQNENGSYLTSSWYQSPTSGLWYYIGADGYMLHSSWTPDNYYVGSDGVMSDEIRRFMEVPLDSGEIVSVEVYEFDETDGSWSGKVVGGDFILHTGRYGDYGKPMYDLLVHDWVNWVAEDEEILRLEAKGLLVNISDENFEAVIKEVLAMERAPRESVPQPTQPAVNNDGFTQEELDEFDRITESLGGAPDVSVLRNPGMSDNGGAYNWGN